MDAKVMRIALVLAVAVVAAGCGSEGARKSGAAPDPVTLVLASNDGEGLDGAPAVAHFVERLEEISGGRVSVQVESAWKSGQDEVQVLLDVAAGEADLGWAGTRALDRVDVVSLTPLHAPFLVDSFNAQRAVIADPDVLQGLDELASAGLDGLALLADELRIPVGISRPLISPEDYEGAQIRTVMSDIQEEALSVLGAIPTHGSIQPTMDGVETMWWTYGAIRAYDFAKFPTVNTPLWPRSVVLVANPEAMEGFDEQVSAWIRAAAQDAASWALEHARDREAAEMADACAGGARFVVATESQIDALRARVQPVYDRLQSDPSTAEIFSRVQQLADAAPPDEPAAIPPGCQFVPGDEELAPDVPAQLAAPGDPGDLPQGVYRYELTEEYLRAVGLTEGDVYQNAGIFTYTLTDGRWSYEQEALNDNLASTSCEGFYDVQGQLFIGSVSTVQTVGECAPPLWTATWSFEDGTLRWSGLEGDFAPIYAGEDGWLKIA